MRSSLVEVLAACELAHVRVHPTFQRWGGSRVTGIGRLGVFSERRRLALSDNGLVERTLVLLPFRHVQVGRLQYITATGHLDRLIEVLSVKLSFSQGLLTLHVLQLLKLIDSIAHFVKFILHLAEFLIFPFFFADWLHTLLFQSLSLVG